MTGRKDIDQPPFNTRPYNCDLSSKNNIYFVLDQIAASDLKDLAGGGRRLSWLDMGDIFEAEIPEKPTETAKITICDADRKKKHITFKTDFTVPFVCICLSDFTQYYTFSARYNAAVYQFEIFRQRVPELEVASSKEEQMNKYSARVEVFINNLSSLSEIQADSTREGIIGGWQRGGGY